MVLINLDQQHFIGLVQEAILVRDDCFLLYSPFSKDEEFKHILLVFRYSIDTV